MSWELRIIIKEKGTKSKQIVQFNKEDDIYGVFNNIVLKNQNNLLNRNEVFTIEEYIYIDILKLQNTKNNMFAVMPPITPDEYFNVIAKEQILNDLAHYELDQLY